MRFVNSKFNEYIPNKSKSKVKKGKFINSVAMMVFLKIQLEENIFLRKRLNRFNVNFCA